ncbi:MAG: restriction endonuclease subunit S [Alteraurantiacibacter sp.]
MTLGDLVALQRGHDLPASTRTTGRVPVMGSFGITGWHNAVKAKGPGVTVGRSGASIGVVSYTEDDFWPLNTCMYVTDFKGNDPRFVYYFLQTVNLASHNSGSAQPSLNRNYIYPIDIAVPGPVEQREISVLLGALDDKIELNRRMSATLEEMARALYRSWFVDFDPVHARALGQSPAHMDPTTAALFPDSFGPDGLPKGWEAGTLMEMAQLNPEKWSKRSHPDEVRYLDLANVKWGLSSLYLTTSGMRRHRAHGWSSARAIPSWGLSGPGTGHTH